MIVVIPRVRVQAASGGPFWSPLFPLAWSCVRITGARGRRILGPSFLAAAVAWCVSYCLRRSGHAACCVLHRVERMQRVAVLFRVALGWCPLASCDVPCVVQHAACRAVAYCSFCGFCFVAHCVHVGCCCHHRATVRHAHVQGPYRRGGVLYMTSGRATFESVAISDTTAREVRVATEADRV